MSTSTAICPPSVAEDRRGAVADPLPERRRTADASVLDELGPLELAGVEADRTDEKLAAAVRELLEEPQERRAAVAGDALSLSGQRQPDGVFEEEHHHLLALLQRSSCHEESGRDTLGVLESGCEVEYDLVSHQPS